MNVCLFLCCLMVPSFRGASAEEEEEEEKVERTQALAESIFKFAELCGGSKTAIWFEDDGKSLISGIVRKLTIPILLNCWESSEREGLDARRPNDLVVFLNEPNVERSLLGTLWTASTRFLVLARDFDKLEKSFALLWKHKIINGFGLVEPPGTFFVVFYGFFPYSKNHCGTVKMMQVDRYTVKNKDFDGGGALFDNSDRMEDMNGCSVNITVADVKPITIFPDESKRNGSSQLEGTEGLLMGEVAKRFNFSPTFRVASDGVGWGWIRPSPAGAVGEVFTGKSDFASGLLAATMDRYENLEISVPYGAMECVTYGVPKGAGMSAPGWITILVFEFTPVTWILLFFSFLSVFLTLSSANECAGEKFFHGKFDIFLYEFSSCLGFPVKIPEPSFARILVLAWFLFAFVATLAYKSSISSKLTVPSADPDVDTFEELLRSRLQLTGYSNMLRVLDYNGSETVIKDMKKKFRVTDFDINFALRVIVEERNMAHMRHTSTFLYYSLIDPASRDKIHVMSDCALSYYPIIVMKKNSPFGHKLNRLIMALRESGIPAKWRSHYIYDVPLTRKPFYRLSMDHMYGIFCIWLAGCALGLMAFLAESFRGKRKRVIVGRLQNE